MIKAAVKGNGNMKALFLSYLKNNLLLKTEFGDGASYQFISASG